MKDFGKIMLIGIIIAIGIYFFFYYISNSEKTSSNIIAIKEASADNNSVEDNSKNKVIDNSNMTSENKTLLDNSNLNFDWIIGKWQATTAEFGLTTLVVNRNNVIFYGANTDHFVGTYQIEDNVMYCFFQTENIKFPLDVKNQIIDFGQGYFAKKVQ